MVSSMVQYKIKTVEAPFTKRKVDEKMAEWEQVLNNMAADGWRVICTLSAFQREAFVFEHEWGVLRLPQFRIFTRWGIEDQNLSRPEHLEGLTEDGSKLGEIEFLL